MRCSPVCNVLFLTVLSAPSAGGILAEDPALVPVEIDWRDNDGCAVDLSRLLRRPAGRDGPICIRDGHFTDAKGRRLRFWGVNLTGGACFPEKEDAPIVARHLARHGVNCVRFHFLDSNWGADATVFDPSEDTTQALDDSQMDRLDFFVAELKRQGIYANFNLNVGRVYRKGDGVADHEYIGFAKGVQYYDGHVADLHAAYAKLLLGHRNRYTGTRYHEEPALAIVELVNENSLVEAWFAGRLRGKEEQKNPGTWADVTPHYARLLGAKYNEWLGTHLGAKDLDELRRTAGVARGEPVPRLDPDEFSKAGDSRFRAEARFYMELEDAYFQRMAALLREMPLRAAVVATGDHNHWRSGYPLLASASKLDVVDGHVYWQHPRYTRKGGGQRGFWIANTPMVNDPLFSTVVQLSRSAVLGKPYTVSETNHPFPNAYACEGIPILTAYALLQDWDGLFFYTFEHKDPRQWHQRTPGHFDIRRDPAKMASLAAGALMFHRGDVRKASRSINRSYSRVEVVESIRLPPSERPFFTPGLSPVLPLIHATRIESFEKARASYPRLDVGQPIVSDTGELRWHHEGPGGLVTIETERTQAAVGYVRNHQPKLSRLVPRVENEFCSIILTSLDGAALNRSSKMLLLAASRSELTGMRWDEKRNTLVEWGNPPFCIEPVRGSVSVPGREEGEVLEVIPLSGSGRALGDGVTTRVERAMCGIALDQPVVWYLIRRQGG